MKFEICHLYPDLLNLYGDMGNVLCLKKRLEWRGVEVNITSVSVGEKLDAARFDFFFIGGGQDFEQSVLLEDLHAGKDAEIKSAINDEKTFLAICGGYQMLGNYYKSHTGQQCDFIGALDFYSIGSDKRLIGDYCFECSPESGSSTVVGFENHSGKTYLGGNLSPLGKIIKGFGNNGEDSTEGAHFLNTFGTYCHGPLLPKNPDFTDAILLTALKQRYPDAELSPLDDSLENQAHDYIYRRLMQENI